MGIGREGGRERGREREKERERGVNSKKTHIMHMWLIACNSYAVRTSISS